MNPFAQLENVDRKWQVEENGIDLSYDADFLSPEDADRLFAALMEEVPWRRPRINTPGGRIPKPRQIAWFADNRMTYTYSGQTQPGEVWTPAMAEIRALVEKRLSIPFNGCLANRYETERDSVMMHSDDEATMDISKPIASVSLGQVRDFVIRHNEIKANRRVLSLGHGSMLVMAGETQKVSRHGLLKSKEPCGPRINLTFRVRILE